MHVLVTGGAGFIGSHLVEALLGRGDRVTVLDNFDPYYDPAIKRANLALAREFDNFKLVTGDIRDAMVLRDIFRPDPPDAVVHLAAMAGVRLSLAEPLECNSVNLDGTVNVLEACRSYGVRRFVLASTSSAYGSSPLIPFREDDPLLHCVSPYGATKIACEKYAYLYHQVYDLNCAVLRFFTAHGPRQRPDMAIHKFTRAIIDGEELTLFGDGTTSRDYTYIGDIIAGVMAALDAGFAFEIINLGNCVATPLSEVISLIEQACGKQAVVRRLPEQPGDPPHTCAEISRAREVLGFEPQVPLAEGIKLFVEWYRANCC